MVFLHLSAFSLLSLSIFIYLFLNSLLDCRTGSTDPIVNLKKKMDGKMPRDEGITLDIALVHESKLQSCLVEIATVHRWGFSRS
jgi:hypothetical protein